MWRCNLLVAQFSLEFKQHYLFLVRPFTLYQVWAKMIEPSLSNLFGVSVADMRSNWSPPNLPFSFDIIIIENLQKLLVFLLHEFRWKGLCLITGVEIRAQRWNAHSVDVPLDSNSSSWSFENLAYCSLLSSSSVLSYRWSLLLPCCLMRTERSWERT